MGFNYHDKFFMVNVLVYMVIHWTKLTISHDVRLLGYYDFIKVLCCIVS